MAAFIIRAKYGENFTYTQTPYFTDVPSTNAYFKYIQKMKDDGITTATGAYNVDDYVTRGQMAAFIIRAKYGEDFSYTQTPYFTDVPSTNAYFKYVQRLKDDGITTATGAYNVDDYVTRGQMAAFIARAFLTYTVTPSAGLNGSLSPSAPQTVNYGATAQFTVSPTSGYSISSVTGCGGTLSNYTYTTAAITENCTVTAAFTGNGSPVTYTVTPSAGSNGSISPVAPQPVTSGSTASFTVTPEPGYTASVTGCNGTLNGNTYTTGTITTDCTVSAGFSQNGSGSVIYTGTQQNGYEADKAFDNNSATGCSLYGGGQISVGRDFGTAVNIGSLNVQRNSIGDMSWSGTLQYSDDNATWLDTNVTNISVAYNNGTGFVTYQVNDIGAHVYWRILLTSGSYLQATEFQMVQRSGTVSYTITSSAGTGGSITPLGETTVDSGSSQTFTITPSTGYYAADVLVDGASVGGVSSYTFSNITDNHTISATFTESGGSGSGGIDQYTALMLHGDGSNGTQSFPDASNNNWTATVTNSGGYPQVTTSAYQFSTGSIKGSTSGYITYPDSSLWDFGSGDFTIDFRLRGINASGGNGGIIMRSAGYGMGTDCPWAILYGVSGNVEVYMYDSTETSFMWGTSMGSIDTNAFHHYALVRQGSAFTTYKDGIAVNTVTNSNAVRATAGSQPLSIFNYANQYNSMYLDEVRISKGIARWTGNFTPPAQPYDGGQSPATTYTITSSAGTGGSIAPSGVTTVNSGDSQTYTITPSTGYAITDVLVDGVSVGGVGSYTFSNVTADHTISATFAVTSGTVTYTAGQSGTFTVPSGVTNLTITMWGGGAGGYAGQSGAWNGDGGGGAGAIVGYQLTVTPSQTINYSVGSGGQGGQTQNSLGAAGGSTSFGSLIAYGGQPGLQYGGSGGTGGSATDDIDTAAGGSGGTTSANGGNGQQVAASGGMLYGGGGGGAPFAYSACSSGLGGGSYSNTTACGGYGGGGGASYGIGGNGYQSSTQADSGVDGGGGAGLWAAAGYMAGNGGAGGLQILY